MFPSVRRVAVATSSSATAASAAAATLVGGQRVMAPTHGQRQRPQQRRYSSSKPSSPDGSGSSDLPSSSSSSSPSSSSSSSSPTTPKRRRKTKAAASSSSSTTATSSTSPRASSAAASAAAASAAAAAAAAKLPSVPSTQHLPIESLALSAFFSQHRPISVTHSLPKIVTDDAFASIFAQAPSAASRRAGGSSSSSGGGGGGGGRSAAGPHRASDVIRTLTKTVDDLEGPMAALAVSGGKGSARRSSKKDQQQQQQEAAAAMARRQELLQQLEEDNDASSSSSSSSRSPTIEFKHADGSDSGISVQLHALASQLLPFQPPPAPVAEETGAEDLMDASSSSSSADVDSSAAADEGMFADDAEMTTTRVFKAVLTIEEQRDAQGQIRIVAHTPQIVEDSDEGELAVSGGEGRRRLELNADSGSDRRVRRSDDNHGSKRASPARSFLARMALRQLRYDDATAHWQATLMEALSVKRQRKLKMKKKKYKKLMRRTRTLRRRQDRA